MSPVSAHLDLDHRRREISAGLDAKQRSALGQFLTPMSTASFMAGLPSFQKNSAVHLLDPGAGIGALCAAVGHRWQGPEATGPLCVICYEIEPEFWSPLATTLADIPNIEYDIRKTDFIEAAVLAALAASVRIRMSS